MPIIRLQIQKDSRREALASALAEKHEVLPGGFSSGQDRQENLLIVDHESVQRTGPMALKKYRERDPRPVSPILLLVPSGRKSDLTPAIWKQIDDVVQMPVRWPEMDSRVGVLIRMQELGKKEESFRQMSAKYKLMLEEQQRRLEGYTGLFKNSTRGALLLREGEVVEANLEAEKLLGTEDLMGQAFGALSAPEQPNGQNSNLKAKDLLGVAKGEEREAEWAFQRPGGETFLSRVAFTSVQFKGEKCVHVLFPEGATEPGEVVPEV